MTDINLNKCLVQKSHFGYDEYVNICTHQVQDVVPWTAADYFEFSIGLLCVVLMIGAFVCLSYIIKEGLK